MAVHFYVYVNKTLVYYVSLFLFSVYFERVLLPLLLRMGLTRVMTATFILKNNDEISFLPQMTPDTAKVKCKNFLSTLLRLANEQPESVATNVRMLIQGLVDAKVEPEEFTTKLQRELNSSPQPCLIPFLKVGVSARNVG